LHFESPGGLRGAVIGLGDTLEGELAHENIRYWRKAIQLFSSSLL
jgi:hypothetical protein